MITLNDINEFKVRVKQSIRDKTKKASIKKADVADRLDELADIALRSSPDTGTGYVTRIRLAPADFTVLWSYLNSGLKGVDYTLDITGGATLKEGTDYVLLDTGGFQLINGVVLGQTDKLILTGYSAFISEPIVDQTSFPYYLPHNLTS